MATRDQHRRTVFGDRQDVQPRVLAGSDREFYILAVAEGLAIQVHLDSKSRIPVPAVIEDLRAERYVDAIAAAREARDAGRVELLVDDECV